MTVRNLRAVLTAILLGTATAGVTALALTIPAQALTASPKVGPLLKEAVSMINAKNYAGAKAKLAEADAAKSTPDDTALITQIRNAISISSADPNTPGGAKAKFAQDYNAGKFKDAIADAEYLKKNNVFDAASQLIVGQAYYKARDFEGCVKYAKTLGSGNETALALQARCAYETGDEATQRDALEQLVARTGKAEYWTGLLKLGERSRGISDHNTLDINRLRLITGSMQNKDDYISLAQFALQFKCAGEAQAALDKGVAAKLLTDDRSMRLLAGAKAQVAASQGDRAKDLAAANASPQGDGGGGLVDIGERMVGEGKAKDAIVMIQNGMKKQLKDPANAQIRLGQAYLAAGQKADAKAAFAKVKAPEKDAMVAHLWSLAAR
jgi:hypothetical protein